MSQLRTPLRVIAVLAAAALLFAACGGDGDETSDDGGGGGGDAPSVALVLNGELGDEAFFDSADRGATQAEEELGIEVNVIEAGLDAAGWEPALRSAVASGDYDLVITGTQPMADVLGPIAEEFPDQDFIFYDGELEAPNVHSITYAQNEASYLGGVVAAGVIAEGSLEGVDPDAGLGFVGGLDLPVINDFLAGFRQGAESVTPGITVDAAYAGGFGDPARGRELAEAQYDGGAEVVFQVAGGTGFGVFEAATARGAYAIGVDTNQNALAPGAILTSVLKNVDVSLVDALTRYVEDELPMGETSTLGLADGAVGLARDAHYEELVPASVRAQVDEAEAAIVSGEIDVDTTLG